MKKQTDDNTAEAKKQRETATSKLKKEMVTKLQKKDEQFKHVIKPFLKVRQDAT